MTLFHLVFENTLKESALAKLVVAISTSEKCAVLLKEWMAASILRNNYST